MLAKAAIWAPVLALRQQPSLRNICKDHRARFSVRPGCSHHRQESRLTGASREPRPGQRGQLRWATRKRSQTGTFPISLVFPRALITGVPSRFFTDDGFPAFGSRDVLLSETTADAGAKRAGHRAMAGSPLRRASTGRRGEGRRTGEERTGQERTGEDISPQRRAPRPTPGPSLPHPLYQP